MRSQAKTGIVIPPPQAPTSTLAELWNWHKGQFKCRMIHWPPEHWFMCMGQAPVKQQEFYGYLDNGYATGFQPNEKGWVKIN